MRKIRDILLNKDQLREVHSFLFFLEGDFDRLASNRAQIYKGGWEQRKKRVKQLLKYFKENNVKRKI